MVYLKSVDNVITLGKLIGLLFLFCLPLLYFVFENQEERPARPVMGTIFLVYIGTSISLKTNLNLEIETGEPATKHTDR